MAFRELEESLKLPTGATERFRRLEALGRMLAGTLYDDLPYAFEDEKDERKRHLPMRSRRPSVDFNLAYEITQDTLAELFGDEQFPSLHVAGDESGDPKAKKATDEALADLVNALCLPDLLACAYEEGAVGAVGVTVQASDDGSPFIDVLPAKWCRPIYRSPISNTLVGLEVTYPISEAAAREIDPTAVEDERNKGDETYWYRYMFAANVIIEYQPMADRRYARLGQFEPDGKTVIAFEKLSEKSHGFGSRAPVWYAKNLISKPRDLEGPCLWWPVRNICIEIDYTLSQCGRGLRYSADPMLFVRRGDLFDQDDVAAGYVPAGGGMATVKGDRGEMVKGVTQTMVGGPGSDAKLLEISAKGITEEREFVRDLREYALEVLGGMKARAEHLKGAPSGRAIDKGLKPLRRLVRRQRRPYGEGLLIGLIDLILYGYQCGALDRRTIESDVQIDAIPTNVRFVAEWPNDETLQGQDLLYHVQGLQMAAGRSAVAPGELINPEVIGAKLADDLGMHEPYASIKGDVDKVIPTTPDAKPPIVKP